MRTARIEALADGVFAIAMTLLVIEIHVPEIEYATPALLWGALAGLFPRIAAYVVSFVILGTLWIGHHNHFVHIRRADRTLLWINVFFLCSIGFLPFSTAFVGTYWQHSVASVLYGVNLLAAGVFLWLHWVYATRGRRLVDPDLDARAIRYGRQRIEAGFAVYGAATLAGFFSTWTSLALFALMPIAYMLPGRVDRHLRTE